MNLISTIGLTKKYTANAEETPAVNDISFDVDAGDFAAIIGPSGSGKSTLISLIGGLIHPSSGTVKVDEIDIFTLDQEKLADYRKEYIGFVFQAFNLLPYLNVFENVMLPLAVCALPTDERRSMALNILEKVGLQNKGQRLPSELSGGEQERVAIARALVNKPPIILADEPTGNLDSENGKMVMELFQNLNREGQTILMVTHNEGFLKYAQKCIIIEDGAIQQIYD